jgi:hypothetical protein
MSIESILKRKGTDVTTIAPEATIKRAATGSAQRILARSW